MKKLLFILALTFCISPIFAKSYSEYLAEAKKYEAQKKWCYALGSYYDAMGTDEKPEDKQEAYEGYKALSEAIKSGNPGLGKFNKFTFYDEWKNLLVDTEKYGSSICIFDIIMGDLVEESLDYKTKTATYSAKIDYMLGERFKKTTSIVMEGFKTAYRDDWEDIPAGWPFDSFTASQVEESDDYNIDGVLFFCAMTAHVNLDIELEITGQEFPGNLNSFMGGYFAKYIYNSSYYDCESYMCKFNIVDEEGKELVKGEECALGKYASVSFDKINSDIMDLIDSGKAFLNLESCCLLGGMCISNRGGYFVRLQDNGYTIDYNQSAEKVLISKDKVNCKTWPAYIKDMMAEININGKTNLVMKTEVTQELYETVMEENPGWWKGEKLPDEYRFGEAYYYGESYMPDLPVECVSYYDAICFCNKLSEMAGLVPVYVVSGKSNVEDWGYRPHNGEKINETYLYENESANGFRLPTYNEWRDVANAGENYEFAGSENLNEVGWWSGNSESKTHPVAQKKPNGYGLYDMSGNVSEWVDFTLDRLSYTVIRGCLGGSYSHDGLWCSVRDGATRTYSERAYSNIGFRVMRSISE